MAADGHTYERGAIETWLRRRVSSPLTNAPLGSRGVTPNENLRELIQEFLDGRPELARRDQARTATARERPSPTRSFPAAGACRLVEYFGQKSPDRPCFVEYFGWGLCCSQLRVPPRAKAVRRRRVGGRVMHRNRCVLLLPS